VVKGWNHKKGSGGLDALLNPKYKSKNSSQRSNIKSNINLTCPAPEIPIQAVGGVASWNQ